MATAFSQGQIVIVGASGFIGKPTFRALERVVGGNRIIVATRNPGSPTAVTFTAAGARVVYGDLNDPDTLIPAFTGSSAIYIITPGSEDRAELVKKGLEAAKTASAPYVMVLSVSTADNTRTTFGKQFAQIEKETKDSGLNYTLLRVPMFTDNLWMQSDSIKHQGKFYSPMSNTTAKTSVCVNDVGLAAAMILDNPSPHHGKTYNIVGPAWTNDDAAAAFSSLLGRSVICEHTTYEAAEKQFMDMGWWEPWQVKGMLELMQLADDGRYNFKDTDFRKITGREPTSVQQWIESMRSEFRLGPATRSSTGTATATN